ncbi:MAG: hypothetical protein JWP27_454 [Flaviaesturariibacter sp.]|nr:hypothetical protein [Flaviaesturariibacter sp.]
MPFAAPIFTKPIQSNRKAKRSYIQKNHIQLSFRKNLKHHLNTKRLQKNLLLEGFFVFGDGRLVWVLLYCSKQM